MAIEWAPAGIRINIFCPTSIRTEPTQNTLGDPDKTAWNSSKIKLGRIGPGEDVMARVQFLASEASSLITGTSPLVDSGWTVG